MQSRWQTKADLHVHSKYSDRPSDWFLRRIGAPECFVEPIELYEAARRHGMDFVTVADHNSIAGSLEIAHLPGTFLSAEVTTYFPEDGCKLHCLVTGITERQFAAIQEIRANIYELHRYLDDQEILCSITHPLFRVNDRLEIEHLEKLLVMFKRFECVNGARCRHSGQLIRAICQELTPESIERMADRHGLEPTGPEPWKKSFTGGSDDHSGIYVGSAHTVTPLADDVDEFLNHLRHGDHEAAGACGGSLTLGHSLYQIAYSYYKDRILHDNRKPNVLGELLARLLSESGGNGTSKPKSFLPKFALDLMAERKKRQLSDIERLLVDEFSTLVGKDDSKIAPTDPVTERRFFRSTSHIAHALTYSFMRQCGEHLREGRWLDSLQTAVSLGPVALGIAPYLAAFAAQHRDDPFLRSVAGHFEATSALAARRGRKAWVTDTFSDVNGVARTIQTLGRLARSKSRALTVLTCLEQAPEAKIDLKNFAPVGVFSLPEYEIQELAFPPFLEVIEYIERQDFGELIISTPGPLGLTALAAARMLRLRMTGIYHTDFPLIVRHLTRDQRLEQLTWNYMLWFYSQMDRILVPSEYYRRHLAENGFDPEKMSVMVRGVDPQQFNPQKRDPRFFSRWGLADGFTFLYVGRVSPDKSVDVALRAFVQLAETMPGIRLAVVGDGPALVGLRQQYDHPRIAFTGFLRGEDLARAYASGDALVFPSTTDTFGNVVLEAHASGLPALVSNRGGPPDIIARRGSGMILDTSTPEAYAAAMARLVEDPELYRSLRAAALATARDSTWDQVLEEFWRYDDRETESEKKVGKLRGLRTSALGLIDLEVS